MNPQRVQPSSFLFVSTFVKRQVGTAGDDQIVCVVESEDGSMILGGMSYVFNWLYYGGTTWGGVDVIAIRLDADGTQVWGWQVKRPIVDP